MDKFEYSGYWWLPNHSEKAIAGTLKFDPMDGASLDLIGSFKDVQSINAVLEFGLILGFANGKKVSLYRCFETNSHMSLNAGMPVFLTSSFVVGVVFVGHHFEKEEDITFKSLSINYSHFEEWTRITGFKFILSTNNQNHLNEYQVTYSFPDKIETKIGDINISFDYSFHDGGDRIKEYHLEQTTFLKIEPVSPLHFNDYLNNICYHLQNFLSLGIGKAVYPLIVKGKNDNCKTELEQGKVTYNDIDIFYQIRNVLDTSKKLHPLDMFFCFGDIKDDFGAYLNNWFKKSELIQPVYDLYFATLYSPKMYLQYEFLALAQALEAYHRRIYGGEYMSEQEYQQIYDGLTNAIPETTEVDFKATLKEKLKYLNEFSLRRRIKETLEKLGDLVNVLITNTKNFTDDVVNTRNFLTHYDKSLEKSEKRGQELYDLIERMKFVLEISFLVEMGLPPDKIKGLTSRNQRYKYLAQRPK